MSKDKAKSLVLYMVIWFLVWNALDFLWTTILVKGTYQFETWDNLLEPLLIAFLVWVVNDLKPWKKKQ